MAVSKKRWEEIKKYSKKIDSISNKYWFFNTSEDIKQDIYLNIFKELKNKNRKNKNRTIEDIIVDAIDNVRRDNTTQQKLFERCNIEYFSDCYFGDSKAGSNNAYEHALDFYAISKLLTKRELELWNLLMMGIADSEIEDIMGYKDNVSLRVNKHNIWKKIIFSEET